MDAPGAFFLRSSHGPVPGPEEPIGAASETLFGPTVVSYATCKLTKGRHSRHLGTGVPRPPFSRCCHDSGSGCCGPK